MWKRRTMCPAFSHPHRRPLWLGIIPHFVVVSPLHKSSCSALQQRSKFMVGVRRAYRDPFKTAPLVPRLCHFEPPSCKGSHSFSWMLGMLDVGSGNVVGRQVARDHPPPDPIRPHEALHGPDRRVRRYMPRGPIPDGSVIYLLGRQILSDTSSLFLTPAFFDFRISVVGHGHSDHLQRKIISLSRGLLRFSENRK
jgi:hypothetical protein